MKKRLIGFAMALCLLVGSAMSVSAQQIYGDGGSADVSISYDNQSTFTINIPESIDLSDPEGYKFTAEYMYITDGEMVCVYAPEDPIPMTNEWGASGTVKLNLNEGGRVATFYRDQTVSDTVVYGVFNGMDAGHYTGTATFTVKLMPKV